MSDDQGWVTVASRTTLAEGEVAGVSVGDQHIALYMIEGEVYATGNICTHAFALLSDGWVDGDAIECPLHAGRFDIKTGKALGPPVTEDVPVFPVRIVGDDIQIRLAS
jgi:naphthalene 1,2-dioxygenase system ferredoxin subunit